MASDDDLYVNSGETYDTTYYPAAPFAQVEEEAREKSVRAASYPIMDELADWWKELIDSCDDIHNISVTEMTLNDVKYSRTVSIEAQVLAYQLLKEKLIEKYSLFEGFGKDGEL